VIIVVTISFTVIGVIGSLLGTIYMSRTKLHESALKQLVYDVKELAAPINRFYSDRKDDLEGIIGDSCISETLSESEALKEPDGTFSVDDAVKGQPEDIYPSITELMSEKFDELKEKNFYNEKIYTRFVFSDTKGNPLVDTQPRVKKKKSQPEWGKYLTPKSHRSFIISKNDDKLSGMMVSVPFFFKEHYLGQIFADISLEPVHQYLLEKEKKLSGRALGLVSDKAIFLQKKIGVPSDFGKTQSKKTLSV